MLRFILILVFIAQSLLGKGQLQKHYYDGAIEKLMNRSWVCERACIKDTCRQQDDYYRIYMMPGEPFRGPEDNKYEKRLECKAIGQKIYHFDSIKGAKIVVFDNEDWFFIDSNSNIDKTFLFVGWSSGEFITGGGITGSVNELQFLSDSTFVISWDDDRRSVKGYYKNYYKLTKTPPDFYSRYSIKPN